MPVEIEFQTQTPIMWRAYNVGISAENRLALASPVQGAKYDEEEFAATCERYGDSGSGSYVAAEIRHRIHTSHVILPGQLNKRPEQRDGAKSAARKLCVAHLEVGSCSCGVWGYKAPARVQHEYLGSNFWKGFGSQNNLEILCAVRCYGTVFEGLWGYRSSNVEIEAMFVPQAPDAYVPVDRDMRPLVNGAVAVITTKPGYGATPKRLDPEAIYNRLRKDYSCQVISVPNGVEHIKELDKTHPDPVLKPVGWEPPDIVNPLSDWTFE
jgi:hypothetical protein